MSLILLAFTLHRQHRKRWNPIKTDAQIKKSMGNKLGEMRSRERRLNPGQPL